MPSGQTLHAEAVRHYQARGFLSQKDLKHRWGFSNVRAVQRARKEFGLLPTDFWGVNPLFSLADIERAETLRAKKRALMLAAKNKGMNRARLMSIKAARQRAGKRGRK